MIGNEIQVKNIYYMLAYAFQSLNQGPFQFTSGEQFDNIHDLFAAILSKGVARQLKQGLYRSYVSTEAELSTLRGKMKVAESVHLKLQRKTKLACEYDDLSENNRYNQILKLTLRLLAGQPTVSKARRAEMKRELLFFSGVEDVSVDSIRWDTLTFQAENRNYKMLIYVCYFVTKGLLYSDEKGKYKLAAFLDDQKMCHLYEKFILEYYHYHFGHILTVGSPRINWLVEEGRERLPTMQSDIMLRHGGKTLIIDAKYYRQIRQTGRFQSESLRSAHLYQIFAYVKNQDAANDGSVAGMLLYAKTDEAFLPDDEFVMGKNPIYIRTLDLSLEFPRIRDRLDGFAKAFFSLDEPLT